MQYLYAFWQNAYSNRQAALKALAQSVESTYNMVLLNLLIMIRLTQYVLLEEKIRKQKFLPTDEDLNFSTKLNQNIWLQDISNNQIFRAATKQRGLESTDTEELVRTIFKTLYEHPDYKIYTLTEGNYSETDKDMVSLIYNTMLASPMYESLMEEQFAAWHDDKELVQFITTEIIENLGKKPLNSLIYEITHTNEQAQFAIDLFNKTLDDNEYLQSLIVPHLENWDPERVVLLDMIMMKMALTEILFFPTIPVKVSINEYIEISKQYSSPKSKDFINGILDKVMHLLRKEGKIVKTGRGLIE
jgi:N utilization substance protein B